MRNMKDMYWMACFIDSEDKYKPPVGISAPHLAIDDCAKQYAARKHGFLRRTITQRRARRIIDNAIEAGYIEVVGDNTPIHNGHTLRVKTGDGMQLVSHDWKGSHAGLDEQTMRRYPETKEKYAMKYKARFAFMSGLVGAVIGAVALITVAIIKGYFKS